MAGLFHTLGMGADSLFASRQGVDTAGHNIANAQTEGFSRQRVNVTQREPNDIRQVLIGNGAFVQSVSRAHDRYLERHLVEITQQSGYSETYHNEVEALEDIYSPEMQASVADEISNFFNSLRDLSNFPEELTVRTSARESALNLTRSFRRIDVSLRQSQNDLNEKIYGEIEEMNALLRNIAKLNVDIQNLEAGPDRSANDLRDQRDKMVRELSEKVDIHYYTSDGGMLVVRGPGDTLLVDRGFSSKFGPVLKEGSPQFYDIVIIDSQGRLLRDATDVIQNGKLRALLDVRDDRIEKLLDNNNILAHKLATSMNEIHKRGFGINDYKHTVGRDFFNIDEDINFAARSIDISAPVANSIDAISTAMSPDAPGDNVILNDMIKLETEKLLANGNASFSDYYANYVGVHGLDVVRSKHVSEADKILLGDLVARREAVSGVSMDDEAMNLLKWQANFTASSRVITTVDEMLETVLGLKR